jgi:hypothetical protein
MMESFRYDVQGDCHQVPSQLVKETARFCKRRFVTFWKIARKALRDVLWRREIDKVRRAVSSRLRKRGILSEQQLLKLLQD